MKGVIFMTLQNRSIAKCIILTIVTCGIYGIYWAYKMGEEAVKVKDVTDTGVLEGLLCIFVPFIGFFLAEKKFNEGCQAIGFPHEDKSIVYLLLGLFGLSIINYCVMQSELNKIADSGIFNIPQAPQDPTF